VAVGETTITVTPSIVHVTSVIISRDKASLEVGKSDTLTTTVLPKDAVDKNVSWFSNNI
jgi:uncharacterized protein YjdB